MTIKKSLKLITAISLVAISIHSYADSEKVELRNVVTELQHLQQIIKQAKVSANSDARIRFDYKALQKDIDLIRQGIQDYINTVQRDPRQLPAIDGDYQQ